METEPALVEQYVETGRARLVYRHLLQLGEASRFLAEASECAGAQGKFWEMRELLYRRQDDLSGATSFAAVEPLVASLGLDAGQFKQCVGEHTWQPQVEADYAAAQREGVFGRPVLDIDGTRIVGARRLAEYQKVVDALP